jgi:hypothetical protein
LTTTNSMLSRVCGWLQAGGAGIGTGDLEALIRHRLRGEGAHLRALVVMGWRDDERSQVAQGADGEALQSSLPRSSATPVDRPPTMRDVAGLIAQRGSRMT